MDNKTRREWTKKQRFRSAEARQTRLQMLAEDAVIDLARHLCQQQACGAEKAGCAGTGFRSSRCGSCPLESVDELYDLKHS